ncbi:MAG TPA: AI-2E family transporter [Candidatus Dojkabacteria bacterium]|nr:AI-2E family transporter [Candidatus Dojkabacteria bacterium]HQF36417.1 AI-2E family transporter [Candidatus Dojkabacteria bacterium]
MEKDRNIVQIYIGKETIVSVVLTLCGLYLAFIMLKQIFDVILLLFIAYIISIALRPSIDKLISKNVNKNLAILLIYFVLVLFILALFSFIIFPVKAQVDSYVSSGNVKELIDGIASKLGSLEGFLGQFGVNLNKNEIANKITSQLSGTDGLLEGVLMGGVSFANSILTGLFSLFIVIIASIYITFAYDGFMVWGLKLIKNTEKRKEISNLIRLINVKLGYWIQGQIILILIIFLSSLLILTIFKFPLALPLALIAGMFELVPTIGPFISILFPVIIALVMGNAVQLVGVTISYLIIQQVQTYVISPKIMSNAIKIHPFLILLSVLIGGKLMGPIGAVLAIPLAGILGIVFKFYILKEKEEK